MSRQIAIDTLHLRPTPRIAHTEYSLAMNTELVRRLTGMDPNDPATTMASATPTAPWTIGRFIPIAGRSKPHPRIAGTINPGRARDNPENRNNRE